MLHQTTIPWSPERMRRLIFSAICSSGNSANRLKPTSFDIHTLPNKDRLWRLVQQNAQVLSYETSVGAARPSSHHCGRAGSVWRTLWAPPARATALPLMRRPFAIMHSLPGRTGQVDELGARLGADYRS